MGESQSSDFCLATKINKMCLGLRLGCFGYIVSEGPPRVRSGRYKCPKSHPPKASLLVASYSMVTGMRLTRKPNGSGSPGPGG